MNKQLLTSLLILLISKAICFSQILTHEDSLTAGIVASEKATVLSGYGEANYQYNNTFKTAQANLARAVLFVGHKFNNKISFFSELEVENAKVEGGTSGGEIGMEQAFLRFNVNKDLYITAGLFTPRIGIINENHLPTTFNSVLRPQLETQLIPATWREMGVGLYYAVPRISGLNLSASLVNGLDASGLGAGNGLQNARFEGRNATASNLAVNAAILYYYKHFRLQVSGYYGGTVGLTPRKADSLKLNSGAFGTPVGLFEANAQYLSKGFYCKALACIVTIADASSVNRAYATNTPEQMQGYYVEAGYNLLNKTKYEKKKLIVYTRYESFDLNTIVPENGIRNDAWKKSYSTSGIAFQPTAGVVIKADVTVLTTGNYNNVLIINPNPSAPAYVNEQTTISLGAAYSF